MFVCLEPFNSLALLEKLPLTVWMLPLLEEACILLGLSLRVMLTLSLFI
jgi:hypothetical protein